MQIEILPDGRLRHKRHVEVQSLISELRALQPISKVITSSELLGYFDSELDFHPGHGAEGSRFEVRRNDPCEVAYQVLFASPLARDERADLSVVHHSRGSIPLTKEALNAVHRDGEALTNQARQGHAVKVATDRLTVTMMFPDAYRISECSPKLVVTLRDRVGDSSVAQKELERICHSFKIRHNRLELDVENPKLDHAYYFTWRPPSEDSLPEGLRMPELDV